MPILEPGARTGKSTTDVRAGISIGEDGDPMFTLQASKQQGVAHSVSLRGREGGATAELGGEVAGALRASTGGGDKPHVLTGCFWDGGQVSQTLDAVLHKGQTMPEKQRFPAVLQPVCVHGTQDPDIRSNLGHTLGRNHGQENAVMTQYGIEMAGTLTARHDSSPCHDRGQNMVAAAFAENSRGELRFEGGDGSRTGALSTGGGKPGQGVPCAQVHMAVRRLTPVECERLQGFPDNWTSVPSGKKRSVKPDMLAYLQAHHPDLDEAEIKTLVADGTRYKAIGNSMAVPVMHWIGRRIDQWVRQNGGDK